MARQGGERMDEADAVGARLAHPDDPAAAHVDPRFADILKRVEPVLEAARGDDVGILLRRGVDVVVVIIEPGVGELPGLMRLEHAERHAGLEPHLAHALHHRDDRGHVAVLRVAPGGAHAEALAAGVLGLRRRLQHGADVHQFGRLELGLGADRLVAIAAILGAAAGLDRQQRAQLHLARGVVRAVDGLGGEHQVVEGEVEQVGDFRAGPVVADDVPAPAVMLTMFQHPFLSCEACPCGAMDPETRSG
ncbi:unnamed protein product [Rhizophagus irregularis]|uniref:Uncharacterized protein n=1 Tax=Rhizophagus irregularis TaxID=588596 RepID=A0A916EL67_9GLOM|nr:unnamed protein product [Rhizophagus irregularis]